MKSQLESTPRPTWLVALTWITPVALIAAQAYFLMASAPDRDMGHLQKIMYVHVPAAWNAFLAFLLVFIQSVRYLFTRDERADLMAAAAAEVGAVLTGLTLVLGSIWGRPTWGVWWTWDARLTSTAVLFLVYVGYLALRGLTDDPERRGRWSAAVGILGALNVPIVYMSVKWWRTLHQMQSTPSTVDPTYAWGLRANAIAFLLMLIVFVAYRYRGLQAEMLLERRLDEAALSPRDARGREHGCERKRSWWGARMNGMVTNSWPYVIAAYAVTWVVVLGYSIRLYRMARRDTSSSSSAGSNR